MSDTKYGRVTSVFVGPGDTNDVFVNIVTGPKREPRYMKVATPMRGGWYVPQEGDLMEIHSVNGTPVARNPANPPEVSVPTDLTEGDFCLKFTDGTRLHFSRQTDGTVDLLVEADGDISVSAPTGTVNVDGQAVVIGDPSTAVNVAVQDHTHDVGLSDGSTGTTGTPNEAGTSTSIE